MAISYKFTVLIIILISVTALAGCIGSSGSQASPNPMVITTVGTGPTQTPITQETPIPTPMTTATPTPTPVPPAISISNVNITGTVDSGAAQYAMRHDTATFTVTNTGQNVLQNLNIIYQVVTSETADGEAGTSSTDVAIYTNSSEGTLNTGASKDLVVKAPLYPALLQANVTIIATWRGGSLVLYNTTLEPNFSGGINPDDAEAVEEAGSANNP